MGPARNSGDVKRIVGKIHALRQKRDDYKRALHYAEGLLRTALYTSNDILILSKKLGMDKYIDEKFEISGGDRLISIRSNGKTQLVGTLLPKFGGFHLLVNKCTPYAIKDDFNKELGRVKERLEKEYSDAEELNRRTEREKLIVEHDRVQKDLEKEVASLEATARKLGIKDIKGAATRWSKKMAGSASKRRSKDEKDGFVLP